MSSSEEVKATVLEALDDLKAQEVTVLPVGENSSVADYFVIASGTSETHCRAMAQEVQKSLKEKGVLALNSGEGGSAAWTLIDYGPVVVHIFSREARGRYNLEGHWRSAGVFGEGDERAADGEAAPESEESPGS